MLIFMAWVSKRTQLLNSLADAVNALNARLARLESKEAPPPPPLANALDTFATAAVQSSAENLKAMGGFLKDIAEIGAERAGRALGKRRAARARRDPNGKFLPGASPRRANCRLCSNPTIADPTVDEIKAHAGHNGFSSSPSPSPRRSEPAIEVEFEPAPPEPSPEPDPRTFPNLESAPWPNGAAGGHDD